VLIALKAKAQMRHAAKVSTQAVRVKRILVLEIVETIPQEAFGAENNKKYYIKSQRSKLYLIR
jgi:hypothetical protein|tara:strand:- start:1172 stop:1360 length:189 start_codon:yes stop_codon:yes gene_type:complete